MGHGLNLTEGYELGTGKLYSFDFLPPDVKERLIPGVSTKNVENKNQDLINIEKVKKRDRWYMKIEVSSIGSVKAIEKAILDFKRNMNVYKLTHLSEIYYPTEKDFFSSKYEAKCEDQFLNYSFYFADPTISRNADHDASISDLNSIVTKYAMKEELNDVEERLMNGMGIYGMIDQHTPTHIRLREDRFSRYYCNECGKEYAGSPAISYENPNEELPAEIEIGEYMCRACNNVMAIYRVFK